MHTLLHIALLVVKHKHHSYYHKHQTQWDKLMHSTWHDWLLWAFCIVMFIALIGGLIQSGGRVRSYGRYHK